MGRYFEWVDLCVCMLCPRPQEYGITSEEKRTIGGRICHHLLRKIMFDLSAVCRGSDGHWVPCDIGRACK